MNIPGNIISIQSVKLGNEFVIFASSMEKKQLNLAKLGNFQKLQFDIKKSTVSCFEVTTRILEDCVTESAEIHFWIYF
jgi:hypothetical protein